MCWSSVVRGIALLYLQKQIRLHRVEDTQVAFLANCALYIGQKAVIMEVLVMILASGS